MEQKSSRKLNSLRNASLSVLVSLIVALFSFIDRTVFLHKLSAEYLGLNGLFSSIIGFLALSELGIGNAMSYELYKPISENDTPKIYALMKLYQKMYSFVGAFMLIVGTALTPFLHLFLKKSENGIPHLHLFYLLYVISSAISYFFIYRKTLIICYQKEYIITICTGVFKIFTVLFQIILLYTTGSYLWYIICHCIFMLIENITIYIITSKLYPFIADMNKKNRDAYIDNSEKKHIKDNMLAIFYHKIGGTLVFSSDNMIISKFIGLAATGLYSNYTIIINTIGATFSKVITTMIPSMGNLLIESDKKHSEKIFYQVLFVNSWLFGFTSISLICLLNPFITLWLGEKYLLDKTIVIIAIIYFYITNMRLTVLSFKDASGVFVQDKYKPLIEGAVNIIISIPLAIKLGISGVLLGTIISTLSIAFWFEALVFFKNVFSKGISHYLKIQLTYLLYNALILCICYYICSLIRDGSIILFLVKIIICLILPNLIYYITFRKTDKMEYLRRFLPSAQPYYTDTSAAPHSSSDSASQTYNNHS